MSAISGASTSRSRQSVVLATRLSLMALAAAALAFGAAVMPQFFIGQSLGSSANNGELLPWFAAVALLVMAVGPAVWLFGSWRRPKPSPTRMIASIFAVTGLVLTVLATVGAVSVARFGHSVRAMQDGLGPMYLMAAIGATAIQLFVMFLLFQVSKKLYRSVAKKT